MTLLRNLFHRRGRLAYVLAPLLILTLAWLAIDAHSAADTSRPASDSESSPDHISYMGAASCSGSACHGGTSARTKLKIAQNEFYIWSEKDSHAKAYEVLTKPDSKRIAHNLKIEKAERSPRCLVCHAMDVDVPRQGSLYDVTEGVSCESCHGAAEKWLGPHIRKDWDSKRASEYGMVNTKDFGKRADKCLTCHLGVGQNIVDHELIGAGHPRLKFEIDNYSHAMPAHWQMPKEKKDRDWMGAKAWSVGQAVALRNEIHLLASSRKARTGLWPDFVHFDCYACHHDVVDNLRQLSEEEKSQQRWRFREYNGKPGRPVWNSSNYTVFRHLVQQIAPEDVKALDQMISVLHDGLSGKRTAEAFDSTLTKLADLTSALVGKVSNYKFTAQASLTLMRSIAGDGKGIANAGFQSAEQAVLALASLYDSHVDAQGQPGNYKSVKDAIDGLYVDIKQGRGFSAMHFERDLAKLQVSLGGGERGGESALSSSSDMRAAAP
jgi:hypothetical protein